MTTHTSNDQALALAGVFQAGELTRDLARNGQASADALAASVHSIFQLDAPDVAAVFDGVSGMKTGLKALISQVERPQEFHREIMPYVVKLLQLERRLAGDKRRLSLLGEAIQSVADRMHRHDLGDSSKFAALDDIYQQHISTLTPRIMVNGDPMHLQNPETAARIRAALLAGVRAAHLWRQCGGSRWKLVLGRRKLLDATKSLLERAV